jgi:ATP-binding cassette subfamily C protein LapB
MDEPTSNMDSSSEAQMKQTFLKVMPGKTVIMVTHHSSLIELADRLIVMDHGKVVADGPKDIVIQSLQKGQVGGAN